MWTEAVPRPPSAGLPRAMPCTVGSVRPASPLLAPGHPKSSSNPVSLRGPSPSLSCPPAPCQVLGPPSCPHGAASPDPRPHANLLGFSFSGVWSQLWPPQRAVCRGAQLRQLHGPVYLDLTQLCTSFTVSPSLPSGPEREPRGGVSPGPHHGGLRSSQRLPRGSTGPLSSFYVSAHAVSAHTPRVQGLRCHVDSGVQSPRSLGNTHPARGSPS